MSDMNLCLSSPTAAAVGSYKRSLSNVYEVPRDGEYVTLKEMLDWRSPPIHHRAVAPGVALALLDVKGHPFSANHREAEEKRDQLVVPGVVVDVLQE